MTVSVHANVDSAHETSPGVTITCGGAGCHNDVTDAEAIHASHGGCADCHANPDGHAASLICSTCHSAHNLPALHAATMTSASFTVDGTSYGTIACSTCHASSDLRTLHGGDTGCTNCHPNPARAILGTWDHTCTQGGCHNSESTMTVNYHGATVNGSHTTTPGVTASCGSAGCHGDVTNAAAIHASHGGCVDCHANPDGHAASLVCSTCHTPHDLTSLHAAALTSVDFTIHGTDYGVTMCLTCHPVPDLRTIHSNNCAACHTTKVDTTLGGTWNKTCVQGGCHASGAGALAYHRGTGTKVDSAHDTSAGVTTSCGGIGCHGTVTDATAIHAAHGGCADCHANPDGHPASLICSSCHTLHDLPTLHAATMTSVDITIKGVDYGSHSCSDCHASSDLRTLHGGDTGCANCHPNPAAAILGSWNKTCTQGGCHNSESTMTVGQHASLDASHTLASIPTSCVTAGCHTAGASGKDVAALHAVAGGPGCICHAAGKTLTLTCTASGCHPTGAPANHSSGHTAADASATITINSVPYTGQSCSNCHGVLDMQAIHGGTSGCVNCHPAPRSTFTTWDGTCSQGGCHNATSTRTVDVHASVSASHTLGAVPSCVGSGCHTGGTSGKDVAAIHSAAGGPGCVACHNGGALTLVCVTCHPTYPAGPTAHGSHVATVTAAVIWIKGTSYGSHTCTDCHTTLDLQDITQHGACTTCHPTPAGTAPKSYFACNQTGCHADTGTHQGTAVAQHASIDPSHTLGAIPTACVTAGCHTAGADSKDVAALHGGVGGPGCICHAAGKTLTLDCTVAGCHPTYPSVPSSHASHVATVTPTVDITINGHDYGSRACSDCHASLDLQHVTQHASCATCHPTPASTAPKGYFACNQTGCHALSGTHYGTAVGQHAAATINSAHNVTAVTCTQAGCHAGANGGNSDIAAIHATVPNRVDGGCGICHDGTIVSAPTSNCSAAAGCHPTYPSLSAAHGSHVATVTPTADITINSVDYGTHSCSECHSSLDLQHVTQHTACATCHPTPAGTAPKGYFACDQTNCHGGGTLHGTAVAQHVAATLNSAHTLASVPTSCVTAGCHTAGASGKDVAALHAVAGGPGCICHAAGKTLTLTCTASGCHPTGAPANHSSGHTAADASATITINSVPYTGQSCSNCHGVLDMQAIHGGTSGCANCHPAPRSTFTTWDGTCSQGGCHSSESTMTVVQHATATLNSAHTLGSVPTACVAAGCHTAGASGKDVAALHAVAGGPGCICHAAGKTVTLDCTHAGCHTTYPSVPVSHASHVATVGPTVSVSINGTPYGSYSCTTCHASLDLQHVTQHANCATCHPTPAGTAPKGYFACNQTGCHADTGTHQGTAVAQHAPATLNSAHTVTLQTCNASGCHTGAYNGSSDVAAIHNVANANKCVTCHNTSGNTVSTCNTPNCHSSGSTYPMAAYSSASSVVAHPGEVAKHNTTADSQCNNCHGTGGSNWCHPGWGGDCEPGGFSSDLPLIHASHGGCAACHEPGVTLTDDGSVCQKSGCHAVSDMQYYYDNQMD
jgi:hypothetical protein